MATLKTAIDPENLMNPGKVVVFFRLELQESLAVVLELFDRFVDIGERLVPALLDEALRELGLPAPHQLLQGADIQMR